MPAESNVCCVRLVSRQNKQNFCFPKGKMSRQRKPSQQGNQKKRHGECHRQRKQCPFGNVDKCSCPCPCIALRAHAFVPPVVGLPTISGVVPAGAISGVPTTVTITGTNFVVGATTVTIGGLPATNVVVVNSTTITASVPAGANSSGIVVTTPAGSSTFPFPILPPTPPAPTCAFTGNAILFAVLGATTVTNTGPSIVAGNVGVSPGTAVTGFPPGTTVAPYTVQGLGPSTAAQTDAKAAYLHLAGLTPTANLPPDPSGMTLAPGIYKFAISAGLAGTLTLNGEGNPNSVFIFQVPSTLITGSGSVVLLTNSANACNVYWQIKSSATLGSTSTFAGTLIALTSISANANVTVSGRLLALNGAVTLINDLVSLPNCTTCATVP